MSARKHQRLDEIAEPEEEPDAETHAVQINSFRSRVVRDMKAIRPQLERLGVLRSSKPVRVSSGDKHSVLQDTDDFAARHTKCGVLPGVLHGHTQCTDSHAVRHLASLGAPVLTR